MIPRRAEEELRQIAEAIRRSLIVEMVERKSRSSAALGFAQINYGRLFIRDKWTLFVIARELDCSISDLLAPPESRSASAVRWADVVDASELILSIVRELIAPVREVVILRCTGQSWRSVMRKLPDRALFSMTEDFASGCERVGRGAPEACRLVASYDHPRIDRAERRRIAA